MIEREFDDYLALLRGLLRLRKSQCDAIADELRDHMDARLEDLLAEGIPREKAVQIALEEFGDAAGVGQAFLELNRTNQRRWNMKVTAASLLTCTALGLAAMAFWPDSARHVSNPAMAQAGAGGPGASAGPGGYVGAPPPRERTREENNQETAGKLTRVQEKFAIDGTTLSDLAPYIAEICNVNVMLDTHKLAESNVDTSAAINLNLKNVRVDTALELALKQVQAGYYIHDGIVIITSNDALAAVTEVRVYNVADLVYLDGHWPLDPHHGGGPGGMGMPGASGMGMGAPGMMGPGGMGPGGRSGGLPPGGNPYGSGGYGAGGGEGGGPGGKIGGPPGGMGGVGGPPGGFGSPPGGIGGVGGPPGGIGGVGGAPGRGGGPPGGIGGQGPPSGEDAPGAGPGAPRSGGRGAPGAGGGIPGGPGGVSLPGEGAGSTDTGEEPKSGEPGSSSTSSLEILKSIVTAPEQFLAQVGMGAGGGMPAGPGTGGSGEAGGMMMGGMGGGIAGPKYFSKSPEAYSPEERRAVDLIQAVTSAVETNSWVDNGGEGEIRPFEGLLIVRNTPKAHQGIELLLQQIRSARHMPRGGMGMPGMGGTGPGGGYGGPGGPTFPGAGVPR